MKAIGRLENSACCAGAGLPRALTIRNGPEPYPDCSMLEVNPLADVPRANLLRVCKRLEPGCKPTDAEDSTDDGNRNYAFVQIRHLSGPLYGATIGSRTWPDGVTSERTPPRHEPRTMRLFRRCHYRLVKGRDGDRDRCLIIVAARRVGDGLFIEAVCTASVQKNCHHSHSPE